MRPLTKKGQAQAVELVALFRKFTIAAVFTSPYLRCVQTVEPLARAHKLEARTSSDLAEGHGLEGLHRFLDDSKLDHAVLCTHGDIVWELVDDLVARHVIRAGEGGFEKGSTWVLAMKGGTIAKARYLSAP